jgi:hypothetical protein
MLVALELGAEWPEGAVKERAGVLRRVVVQLEGEAPEAYAVRLGALAGKLFASGVELRDVVVACNERTDPGATVARRTLAALLLERLGPSGQFVFAASSRASGRLRHALSALAIDSGSHASASVTVHFGADGVSAERSEAEHAREPAVARVA